MLTRNLISLTGGAQNHVRGQKATPVLFDCLARTDPVLNSVPTKSSAVAERPREAPRC